MKKATFFIINLLLFGGLTLYFADSAYKNCMCIWPPSQTYLSIIREDFLIEALIKSFLLMIFIVSIELIVLFIRKKKK